MTAVQWYTTKQVADLLNTTEYQIRHLCRAGDLGYHHLNPRASRPIYRISSRHIEQYQKRTEHRAA